MAQCDFYFYEEYLFLPCFYSGEPLSDTTFTYTVSCFDYSDLTVLEQIEKAANDIAKQIFR